MALDDLALVCIAAAPRMQTLQCTQFIAARWISLPEGISGALYLVTVVKTNDELLEEPPGLKFLEPLFQLHHMTQKSDPCGGVHRKSVVSQIAVKSTAAHTRACRCVHRKMPSHLDMLVHVTTRGKFHDCVITKDFQNSSMSKKRILSSLSCLTHQLRDGWPSGKPPQI